jgi:hypothetical protein
MFDGFAFGDDETVAWLDDELGILLRADSTLHGHPLQRVRCRALEFVDDLDASEFTIPEGGSTPRMPKWGYSNEEIVTAVPFTVFGYGAHWHWMIDKSEGYPIVKGQVSDRETFAQIEMRAAVDWKPPDEADIFEVEGNSYACKSGELNGSAVTTLFFRLGDTDIKLGPSLNSKDELVHLASRLKPVTIEKPGLTDA